jgi:transcriptional regulator with XRE-family HTH domain
MTLQQIAQRAGVSTPTISKVLNGRPDVAPATREQSYECFMSSNIYLAEHTLPMAHKHIELVFDALTSPNNLEMMRGCFKPQRSRAGM